MRQGGSHGKNDNGGPLVLRGPFIREGLSWYIDDERVWASPPKQAVYWLLLSEPLAEYQSSQPSPAAS